LAIDPDDPLTRYNVACGYTKLGEIEAALDSLETSDPLLREADSKVGLSMTRTSMAAQSSTF